MSRARDAGERQGDRDPHPSQESSPHATDPVTCPRMLRFPGPSSRNDLDRFLEVLGREQPRELLRGDLVGPVDAALEVGAHDALGRPVRLGGPAGQALGEAHALLLQLVVADHAVDDVPALQRGGVVEAAGHHELAGAGGACPLRHPLRAAGAGSQPHDRLDQAEPRRLRGPDHVAAQRNLEPGRETDPVDQGERRDLESLQATNAVDERTGELGRPLRPRVDHGLEVRHVDPAGEDVALRAPDERPRVGGLHLADAVEELLPGVRREEVEGRVVESVTTATSPSRLSVIVAISSPP